MVQKERKASSECAGSLKEWKEAGVDSGARGDEVEVEVEVEVEEAGALPAGAGASRKRWRAWALPAPRCHFGAFLSPSHQSANW